MTDLEAEGPNERTRTRRRWWRRPPSKGRRIGTAMLLSAAAAPLAGASPIGTTGLDLAWSMGIAAAAAYLGSTAKRGPLLVAALLAVVTSRSLFAAFMAILAILLGTLSTRNLKRRAFFARGTSAGAAAVSLLSSAPDLPWWASAVAIAGVVSPIVMSGFRNAAREVRRRIVVVAVLGSLYLVGASGMAAVGALSGAGSVDDGTIALEIGLAAARVGDVATASAQLEVARAELSQAHDAVTRLGLLGRVVPITAQHVSTLSSLLADAERAAGQAGRTAIVAETNELGVRAGRVDLDAVEALQNPLRRLADNLGAVVDEAREGRDEPLLPLVKDRLDRLEGPVTKAWQEAVRASEAAAVLPDLLGIDETRRYLVLFTSPAEARGRFGFPGSFAEVTFDDGRLALLEHGATSEVFFNLRPSAVGLDLRDEQIAPYLSYGPTQTFLSATIPPDFPTVARLARHLWEQSGREPLDGVLRFDPRSLAPLLAFTGPVQVAGVPQPLTAENLEQFLVFDQYLQFPQSNAPRREVLETVSEVVMRRLQGADLPPPRALVDIFQPLVAEGRLGVVAFDERGLDFLDLAGLSGRFTPPTTDSLLVTSVNVTGNKIDSFLTRKVRYDAQVVDGRLTGTVTVELHNAAPPSGLPFYVIGSATQPPLPLGTNRTTLLVYTSLPVVERSIDGEAGVGRTDTTAGRYLHQIVVELPPGATRSVELRLDGEVPDDPYRLVLEPGGGAVPDEYDVEIAVDSGSRHTFRGRVATATRVG
jgi:hypothetical protein